MSMNVQNTLVKDEETAQRVGTLAPGQQPVMSVVIPSHNRSDALARTLEKLAEQQFDEPWEVIVVNHRCSDDTDEVVGRQKFPVPLRLVHKRDTPGVAAARNAGAAVATGHYLLFMDNDILVEPDFAQRHYDALSAHPGCWIMGQLVNLPEQTRTPFGRFRESLYPFTPPGEPVRPVVGLTGQSVSMPRADFERLKGFDEKFDIASVEDFDLALRAKRAGINILYDPSILGVHNDWAGFDIRDYCYRQQTYARCEPLLWEKYGEEHPRPRLVEGNLPPRLSRDGLAGLVRKRFRQLVGTRPAQFALFGVCNVMERVCPWPPVLWRLYRLLLSAAIYKGFQEGLAIHKIEIDEATPVLRSES
ncbi:MAG: glycosyltransferase [Pyrinomonadaceae bacterium]